MATQSPADNIINSVREVHLPRWVNEPLPDVQSILSGHDISRLTRRPRWLLLGLTFLGRFPKRRTHCGKPIGWHRADVLDWLTEHMATEPDTPPVPRTCLRPHPDQACLPLECCTPCPLLHGTGQGRGTRGTRP